MSELLIEGCVLSIVGESEKAPYRWAKQQRYVAIALLLLAVISNFAGQLSLGYSLLGFGVTAIIVWSFAEILAKSRE